MASHIMELRLPQLYYSIRVDLEIGAQESDCEVPKPLVEKRPLGTPRVVDGCNASRQGEVERISLEIKAD